MRLVLCIALLLIGYSSLTAAATIPVSSIPDWSRESAGNEVMRRNQSFDAAANSTVHDLNQRLSAAVALALSCGYDLAEERCGYGRCCARRIMVGWRSHRNDRQGLVA